MLSKGFLRDGKARDLAFLLFLREKTVLQSTNRKLERRVKELSIQIDDERQHVNDQKDQVRARHPVDSSHRGEGLAPCGHAATGKYIRCSLEGHCPHKSSAFSICLCKDRD